MNEIPEIGYSDALAELDAILRALEADNVDVDGLGTRVRRASELIKLCRARIADTELEVEEIVADLEAAAPDDLDEDRV